MSAVTLLESTVFLGSFCCVFILFYFLNKIIIIIIIIATTCFCVSQRCACTCMCKRFKKTKEELKILVLLHSDRNDEASSSITTPK